MKPAIALDGISKTFRTRVRRDGLRGAVRQLVRPTVADVTAVSDLTFAIEPGERVAFVGPNGAGKSTTIKLLSGILHPSAGDAHVLGYVPWRERNALGYEIATVFGQRSRLWLHLPAGDTFDLLARVYDLDDRAYRRRREELVAAFGIVHLVAKPVRQLSLGERMRCELVASLLHAPRVLFLDEPTIGLDVVAKATLRELVRDRSDHEGTTVVLTSHDTGDMEEVCDRVLVIHRGTLLLDRSLAALRREYIRRKAITVVTAEEALDLALEGVEVTARSPHRTSLSVDTERVPVETVVQRVLASAHLHDLTVEDPPMEEIIQAIYAGAERREVAS